MELESLEIDTEIEVQEEVLDVHEEVLEIQEVLDVQEVESEVVPDTVLNPKVTTTVGSTPAPEKLSKLPLTRVKHLMKMDSDVNLASQESIFLIAKATELFVESLVKEAYNYTAQGKRKTVQKKDVDLSIEAVDSLAFLEGTLEGI